MSTKKAFLAALAFLATSAALAAPITVKNNSTSGRSIGLEIKTLSGTWVKSVPSILPGVTDTSNFTQVTIVSIKNNGSDSMCVYVSSAPTLCREQIGGASRQYNHTDGETYVVDKYVDPGCSAAPLGWGTGNICTANTAAASNGASQSLTNAAAGATGTATATCSAGTWSVSAPTCTASLASPVGLFATDGTNASSINTTWGAVAGASSYRLQYRKKGTPGWTDLATPAAASYDWTGVSDESTFEFQVRAENALGSSAWSALDAGSIRPKIAPVFVSQSGIPAKIGTGQSFSYSQIWRNTGSETWSGGSHGTGPDSPGDTSVWGAGFAAFSGSIATGSNTTTSLTATAPTTPGVYQLRRIFWKAGVPYGVASAAASVEVVGPPTCGGVSPSVATTYNANGTVTVSLQGPMSVETAIVKAWGEVNGQDDAKDYPMALNGPNWTATIPVADHLVVGESKINFAARVGNSLFTPVQCASSSVTFQQLPDPVVTLTPTVGSFDAGAGKAGFVAARRDGVFANIKVDLGAFSHLKTDIEFVDSGHADLGVPLNGASAGVDIPARLVESKLVPEVPAWSSQSVIVRVKYADPDAASQNKTWADTISVLVAPSDMQVSATGTVGIPPTVNAQVHAGGSFDTAIHGPFLGGIRTVADGAAASGFVAVGSNGEWGASDLDYSRLYRAQLVAVARAVPPEGVTLIKPIEFLSAPFSLPVQLVRSLAATDGTLEEVVRVSWLAPADGGDGFTFDVYRDSTLISSGKSSVELDDIPPVRGQVYSYKVSAKLNTATSPEAQDPGHLPACFAPRVEDALVNGVMQAELVALSRWLQCVGDAVISVAFDGGGAQPVAFQIAAGSDYRHAAIDISGLADGNHTAVFSVGQAGGLLNGDRSQSFSFSINRAGLLPTDVTILHNGKPASDGVLTDSIGRFGIQLQGGSIDFAQPLN